MQKLAVQVVNEMLSNKCSRKMNKIRNYHIRAKKKGIDILLNRYEDLHKIRIRFCS